MLYLPHPGQDAYWYENPGGKDGPWKKHFALKNVGNESPMWADINGDGRPELIYNIDGYLGYATYDPARPDQAWVFHPITPKGDYQRYTHGIGWGDINGDGRIDLVESGCWWEQPANAKPDQTWIKHPYKFAEAGADARLRRRRRRDAGRHHIVALPSLRPGLAQADPQRQGRDYVRRST